MVEVDWGRLLDDARKLEAAGRRPEAAALYGELLGGPKRLDGLTSLGKISFENGDLQAAQQFLGAALELAPDAVETQHLRGVALMRLGCASAALQCLERALVLDPDFPDALLNHATVLLELKRFDEALAGFDNLLSLDPNNAVGWNNRGNALAALGRFEEATAAYDRAIAADPNLDAARQNRFYALLTLRRVDRISDFAVRDAFDRVAANYDDMMLAEIGYRAHGHLRALASRLPNRVAPPLDILDLGCGTGLAGEQFRDLAQGGRLDGVDISPRMLEQARKRQIYNELILGDFESVLAASGRCYDLVLSSDAIVYLGNLEQTLRGVARRLRPGGIFLFSCEAKTGESWELTEANRFRHSEAYLRTAAVQAGLVWLDHIACIPRLERGLPVQGFVVALGKWTL
jgi:predicted TPR repeat methyltransferase